MKLAVICANGKSGKLVVKEAVDRGIDTTAVVRGENKSEAKKAILKDLFELTADDLEQFDVLVSAFGAWTAETFPLQTTAIKHLSEIIRGTDTRMIIIGGAGSLFLDKEHKIKLLDSKDFPESFLPLAKASSDSLDQLRKEKDVKWTYICPAADFRTDGVRSGKYKISGEELIVNSEGESVISYADYAIAVVDEAVNGKHICKRIGVVSE